MNADRKVGTMQREAGWYRVIANNAGTLFWFAMGIGVGAFGAVFSNAVSVGGEALKVYLGVATVLIGGAIGMMGSRSLDYYSDRRKRRRRLYMICLRIQRLGREWLGLRELITEITGDKLIAIPRENVSRDFAHQFVERLIRLRQAASTPPDFDDVLDSHDDVEHARVTNLTFDYTTQQLEHEDYTTVHADVRISVTADHLYTNAGKHADIAIRSCRQALDHFAARADRE